MIVVINALLESHALVANLMLYFLHGKTNQIHLILGEMALAESIANYAARSCERLDGKCFLLVANCCYVAFD